MHLTSVPAPLVARAWPDVCVWIAEACGRPGCDLDADRLREVCQDGTAALLVISDGARPVAAGVTQVRQHRDHRSCWVLSAGGSNLDAFAWAMREICAGAARVGCDRVEFVGRPGWGRVLPDFEAVRVGETVNYTKFL